MPSIYAFGTWRALLAVLQAGSPQRLGVPGGYVAGSIGHAGWCLPPPEREVPPEGVPRVDAERDAAVQPVRDALAEASLDEISFVVERSPAGDVTLHLLTPGPAVQGGGPYPGALLLVEGGIPEPWRRLPQPVPGVGPARSADPGLLERTLRGRLPEAVGATEAEIGAAEVRLGMALPAELRALYRVTRARREDWSDDVAAGRRVQEAVGLDLRSVDGLRVFDAAERECLWVEAAMEAVVTPADAAVQGLAGSPGWVVFAEDDYGDQYAMDLTPGPGGHVGQIIMLSHEASIGAQLIADSLTDLVVHRRWSEPAEGDDQSPVVAHVNRGSRGSVESFARPELEVLSIGVWEREPISLAAFAGLPRLRTLSVLPGTLADPVEIGGLTGLEFLELGPADWRVLLDAGAVPRSLLAASIQARRGRDHPLETVDLANEILGQWGRPPITRTTVAAA